MQTCCCAAPSSDQGDLHNWKRIRPTTEEKFWPTIKTKQNKGPLEQWQPLQSDSAEGFAVHGPAGVNLGIEQRAACVHHILPSVPWICNVFPDLRMGRTECWHFKDGSLNPQLSLRSQQDYKVNPFHLARQGPSCCPAWQLIVCYVVWTLTCADYYYTGHSGVFTAFLTLLVFTFIMRFGYSLDRALLHYQHVFVCLFSSEAEGTAGLGPGKHFNYTRSITALCFEVTEVHCCKSSEGTNIPTQKHKMLLWPPLFPTLLMFAQKSQRITTQSYWEKNTFFSVILSTAAWRGGGFSAQWGNSQKRVWSQPVLLLL